MEKDQDMPITIRTMQVSDYDQVDDLWKRIHGFAIRSLDDSREYITRFLERNPRTSVVALDGSKIVGSILCGHDGRTGTFYHVCVDEAYRRHHIGRRMVTACMRALQEEKISSITLIAFTSNEVGNEFWNDIGWTKRSDVNRYDFKLNEENIVAFTK